MATKTDYARKCQQLDVLIDLLERISIHPPLAGRDRH